MSCDCNNNSTYYNACRAEVPYPQVSHESVPSLIDNLVTALYGGFYDPQTQTGFITKSVVNGRIVWNIPCDPSNTGTIDNISRNYGEGLLCYIMRALNLVGAGGFVTTNGVQTLTNKTISGSANTFTNIPNSATTATNLNTALAIVSRDGSGNFTAGTITANLTGIATKASNLVSGVAGSVPYQTAVDATGFTLVGTTGQVLTSTGTTAPAWTAQSSLAVGTATNIASGAAGSLLYQTGSGATTTLGIGTARQLLAVNSGSTAPVWQTGIIGTITNDNAAVGYVGEFVNSVLAVGSAVSLTSGTSKSVTSISLTAGDWDVRGQVDYRAGATTSITILTQGISQTDNTLGGQDTYSKYVMAAVIPTASNDIGVPVRPFRISLSSQTTIYLVSNATFTSSTLSAYGTIEARRVR
jgi:hypothetical protein